MLDNKDVINALKLLQEKKITVDDIVDWVNVMWFTDIYDYEDEYADSIASVMNILEELDKEGHTITETDIERYIEALEKNEEVYI